MTKYLVVTEGEYFYFAPSREEALNYIREKAKELKTRGVEDTEYWIADFEKFNYSQRYTDFPEFILPIDEDDLIKAIL